VNPEDVEIMFHPADAVDRAEREHWCRTIAEALEEQPGCVWAVFVRDENQWSATVFQWAAEWGRGHEPRARELSSELRSRALDALRLSGRSVVG
jgi:hypothetical protein